jgi:hypothetical protein
MKTTIPRLLLLSVGVILLTSAYHRTNTVPLMTRAANNFLNSLTPEQRAKATYKFEDDERFDWHFIPKERKGLPLREMTARQKELATALLCAGLSQQGYIKAVSIMSMEEVLRLIENSSTDYRNPEKYFFTVFGAPADSGAWGYRIEGHHVSQNFTIVNGKVIGAPSFFGSNPAEVRQGPHKGMRVLAAEEDLGRDLLNALDGEQKKVAVVDQTAYKDILTAASRKAALQGQASGLQASKMNAKQFEMLMALLEEYARNMPDQLAEAREEQIRKAGKNIYFAWAGVAERGGPHYYRVQAPTFLVEYDNTQNEANHIHSVWRDYEGDFGMDLLKMHYQSSHTNAAAQ